MTYATTLDEVLALRSENEMLRIQLVLAKRALVEMVEAFEPFTSRPMGAPNSDARIKQQLQIAAHRNARSAITSA